MSESNKNNNRTVKKVRDAMETMSGVVIAVFDGFFDIITYVFERIFNINRGSRLMKMVAFILSMLAAVAAIHWAFGFVMAPPAGYTGTEVAAIVGAVLTPVTAIITGVLMKFVFPKMQATETVEAAKPEESESVGNSDEK